MKKRTGENGLTASQVIYIFIEFISRYRCIFSIASRAINKAAVSSPSRDEEARPDIAVHHREGTTRRDDKRGVAPWRPRAAGRM